ncbi:MAG: DUF483 domain-containing protein [Candidatus Altiarchaeota archaeon]|nr:DUF483 domain-containing protein [Candidatus Altiarchaeota archaeon]
MNELVTRSFFPDLFGLYYDFKPASVFLLDGKTNVWITDFKRQCEAVGLFFEISHPNKHDESTIAFVSKSKKLLSELSQYYLNDMVKTGKLLGYPDCCIDFWKALSTGNFEKDILNKLKTSIQNTKNFSSYLNIFSMGNRIISHNPCSFDCKNSLYVAKQLINILKKVDSNKFFEVKTDLNKNLLVKDYHTSLKIKKPLKSKYLNTESSDQTDDGWFIEWDELI